MNNPYEILGVSQNATRSEILQAKIAAMKKKVFRLNEIHAAERQLLNPEQRLAADFMYQARVKATRIQEINFEIDEKSDINFINLKAFDSLIHLK